jgi:hypothetical protein
LKTSLLERNPSRFEPTAQPTQVVDYCTDFYLAPPAYFPRQHLQALAHHSKVAAQAIFAGCLADELPELSGHVTLARPAMIPRA